MRKHIQDLARGSGTQLKFFLLNFKFSPLSTFLPDSTPAGEQWARAWRPPLFPQQKLCSFQQN